MAVRAPAALIALALALTVSGTALAKTTLKVYIREGEPEYSWEMKVFKQFEEKNPDIKIEVISNAGQDYLDKLTAMHAAGDPPDVWNHGGYVATYAYNGWLLNVRHLIERDKNEIDIKDIFPGAWNAYISSDRAWGLPFISLPTWVYYNADLYDQAGLERPPTDWNDKSWTLAKLRENAKKLTRVGPDGKVIQYGLGIATSPYVAVLYARLAGSDWFPREGWQTGLPRASTFADPRNEAIYTALVDMIHKDQIATTNYSAPFFEQKVAMVIGVGGWIVLNKLRIPNAINFRWGFAPNPWSPAQASIIYTDPWMISKQTKNVEAAWRFVKYMTSKEVLQSYMDIAMFPPVRRSVLGDYLKLLSQSSGVLSPQEMLQLLAGAQQYGYEAQDHVLVGESEYRRALTPIFDDMWNNRIPVREALIKADQVVKPIMQKYLSQR